MPTAYTAQLIDENLDFKTFTLLCARAMGACVMLRDEPLSVLPTLENIHRNSQYYEHKIIELENKVEYLENLSKEAQIAYGQKEIDKAIARTNELNAQRTVENEKLMTMKHKVSSWIPPTKDHIGLQNFMLQQLDISLDKIPYRSEVESDPIIQYKKDLAEAKSSKFYNEERHKEEKQRSLERKLWLTDLLKSLPGGL